MERGEGRGERGEGRGERGEGRGERGEGRGERGEGRGERGEGRGERGEGRGERGEGRGERGEGRGERGEGRGERGEGRGERGEGRGERGGGICSLPLCPPSVQGIYTGKFLSEHRVTESDNATWDTPIGDIILVLICICRHVHFTQCCARVRDCGIVLLRNVNKIRN